MRNYCNWLGSQFTTIVVLVGLVLYWSTALTGTLSIQPNITPKKLFLADSLVNELNALRDTYVLPNYTPLSIFVNRVGDLGNARSAC